MSCDIQVSLPRRNGAVYHHPLQIYGHHHQSGVRCLRCKVVVSDASPSFDTLQHQNCSKFPQHKNATQKSDNSPRIPMDSILRGICVFVLQKLVLYTSQHRVKWQNGLFATQNVHFELRKKALLCCNKPKKGNSATQRTKKDEN